jgi:alpha-ketoglutarate-dependent taurine dioxygenase
MEVAALLGVPVPVHGRRPIAQLLSPMSADEAPGNSLSRIHGLGEFPLHTDAAHHRCPPRWLLMRCIAAGEQECPTLLADSQEMTMTATERRELERAVWTVNTGRRSFLASVVLGRVSDRREGPIQIRYDRGCMEIADAAFLATSTRLDQLLGSLRTERIDWEPGITVVIDNARMLHGRGPGADGGGSRKLERVLVVAD